VRVSPFVASFNQQYPQIIVELILADEPVDIVDQRFGLAFRIGWLNDSSNLARKIGDFREVTVCSNKTASRQTIKKPDDLSTVPYVAYRGLNEKKAVFSRKSEKRTVSFESCITCNVTSGMREIVLEGNYFAILPDFSVEQNLAKN